MNGVKITFLIVYPYRKIIMQKKVQFCRPTMLDITDKYVILIVQVLITYQTTRL